MKIDWKSFDRGVFLVNCLAIVYKDGRILIGKRESDEYVKELTWTFPGGRPSYNKTLEESLKEEVLKKTNLRIRIIKLIFARNYPEKPVFMSLYYLAKPIGGEEKPGEKFTEIKWIRPTDVTEYFATSVDPYITEFLSKLKEEKQFLIENNTNSPPKKDDCSEEMQNM